MISKEESWLDFNRRVLQEAEDKTVPLLERLKFLGIFSNNQDEFFRVRVATLNRLTKFKETSIKIIGQDAGDVLKRIQKKVDQQQKLFEKVYKNLQKELILKKIDIIDENSIPIECKNTVYNFFKYKVRPNLFPILVYSFKQISLLRDHSVYLLVNMIFKDSKKKSHFSIIEIPTNTLSRFFMIRDKKNRNKILFLDDVIRTHLKDIFPTQGYHFFKAYAFKVTRDAELELNEDISDSLSRKVEKSLNRRQKGNITRITLDKNIPKHLFRALNQQLNSRNSITIIKGMRYHNFKDFFQFPKVDNKDFYYHQHSTLGHHLIKKNISIFDTIDQNDVLLHFPYQDFHYIIDLLREASLDIRVNEIKITLYRLASNSSVINALINAVKNGKNVTVILELQARFDEEANVRWIKILNQEGIKVIPGVTNLKVHSKLIYIKMKDGKKTKEYGFFGTGNFNEHTARIYTDHCLLTSDKKLTQELRFIFNFFNQNYKVPDTQHLLVSPFNTRKKINFLIDREIKNASQGNDAKIQLKINNFIDHSLRDKIIEAAKSGVKIEIIIRGMFDFDQKILSHPNIEARSIVGRYLEHSRFMIFHHQGRKDIYIGSFDWMPRNLDKRIEVGCPIQDIKLKQEIMDYFNLQWQDNKKARLLDGKTNDKYLKKNRDTKSKTFESQQEIYNYLKVK